MNRHLRIASAAVAVATSAFAAAAFAHPGHGTTPASDGVTPHVHFGAAKPNVAGKLPAKHVKKRSSTHDSPVADKAIRRKR